MIPVAGWRRDQALDQTGLPFIPPSPNLRSLESLFHYPGTCLFEGTNLSVGRGSDAPFEQVGAPWLDTARVLTAIRAAALPGVRFHRGPVHAAKARRRQVCRQYPGWDRLEVTDRASYDPTATAVHLLSVIRTAHREQFKWIPAHFDRLAGGPALREQIEREVSAGEIVESWSRGLEQFRKRREAALLYH